MVNGSIETGSPVDRPCRAPQASTTATAEASRITAAIWAVTVPASERVEAPVARSRVNVLSFWTVRIRKKKPTTTTPITKVMPTRRPKVWLTDSTPGMAAMRLRAVQGLGPLDGLLDLGGDRHRVRAGTTVKATVLIGTAARPGLSSVSRAS